MVGQGLVDKISLLDRSQAQCGAQDSVGEGYFLERELFLRSHLIADHLVAPQQHRDMVFHLLRSFCRSGDAWGEELGHAHHQGPTRLILAERHQVMAFFVFVDR